MIVRAALPCDFPWIQARLGLDVTPAFKAIEAVDANGEIRGMVGYDQWSRSSVQMHICLETPAALRSLLVPMFHYPLVQAGRSLCLGLIADDNERSKNLARRVGFREAHRIRDGFAVGTDLVLFELRREACRYLRGSD